MPTLGVVVAEFYPDPVEEMLALARDRAVERDATVVEVCRVPGVLDTSLPADRLARREGVDAGAEAVETLAALPR